MSTQQHKKVVQTKLSTTAYLAHPRSVACRRADRGRGAPDQTRHLLGVEARQQWVDELVVVVELHGLGEQRPCLQACNASLALVHFPAGMVTKGVYSSI
jgi:hypothetical protein